jgi:hypothetical protein
VRLRRTVDEPGPGVHSPQGGTMACRLCASLRAGYCHERRHAGVPTPCHRDANVAWCRQRCCGPSAPGRSRKKRMALVSSAEGGYQAFRRRLDAVLRQKDPRALTAFLVAEGQWPDPPTTDPEAAMWMMIASSPALRDLHTEARAWLVSHQHEAEAAAIFGRGGGGAGTRPQHVSRRPRSTGGAPPAKPPRGRTEPGKRGPRDGTDHGRGERPPSRRP